MQDASFLRKTFNFARHAVERRTHTERFIIADKTLHEKVYSDGLMELRHYPHQDEQAFMLDGDAVVPQKHQHRIPVLLVPPLGVYHWIYDLMAERSWVRFLNAQGFQVYLVSWGSPGLADAHLSLHDYAIRWMQAAVEQTLRHSGQPQLSLVGYCMGGLISLLHAGTHKDDVIRNIVTIASPIDFHANPGYGKLMHWTSQGIRRLPLPRSLQLDPTRFHVPGDLLSILFNLTNPLASVVNYFDLVRNLSDRDYVKAHLTLGAWFNNMADYPGATVQQLMLDFVVLNKLAEGRMEIRDSVSDIRGIRSNLLAFAGKSDRIVSIPAARKLLELVASEDKTFTVVPGGHAGVFAGGKAQDHTWALTAQWLAQRSD